MPEDEAKRLRVQDLPKLHSARERGNKEGGGVLCDKTSPGEKHTYLLTPDGKATTDQNTNAIKIQIGEPMGFMEVTHRNTGEGLLEE